MTYFNYTFGTYTQWLLVFTCLFLQLYAIEKNNYLGKNTLKFYLKVLIIQQIFLFLFIVELTKLDKILDTIVLSLIHYKNTCPVDDFQSQLYS